MALLAFTLGLVPSLRADGHEQSTAGTHSAAGPPGSTLQLTPTDTTSAAGTASAPLGRSMAGPIFGVVLAFLASTVALGFAFGLRKRINALAGPDPDEGDDD